MIPPAPPRSGTLTGTDSLAARYEELRCKAFGAVGGASAVGLGILVRKGMAAWLTAWSSSGLPMTGAPPPNRPSSPEFFQTLQAEIVMLLAGMVLSRRCGHEQ